MNDPWRFIAFPVAAVVGWALSLGLSTQFSAVTGLGQFTSKLVVVALAGFLAGFMVDEVIPAYLEHVREQRGGIGSGGSSFGGEGGGIDDEDLDFE